MVVIFFVVIVGLTKANTRNLTPFTSLGRRGIFSTSTILFFTYVGFNTISTMIEGTRNPEKDIPFGLVNTMSITTPYNEIGTDTIFSAAFSAIGMDWAKYIVAFRA
ncbi:Cationic amino acid transporter 1 [Platanthera guangdongensis]|uniref:Cationic amino acid transporter 1 n=1 Tax=Platanthera guangdongensis TaxID=2320717 RepID=A0ABR2MNR2_9ASPA